MAPWWPPREGGQGLGCFKTELQALLPWPLLASGAPGRRLPCRRDAGTALRTAGTFTHRKAAARNHPGSNSPRAPEGKMLKVGFSENLPERGFCKCEELVQSGGSSWCPSKHKPKPCSARTAAPRSGDGAEYGCSLCQARPGLYLTWWPASCQPLPSRRALPLRSAVPHPWQVWQRLGTSSACLPLLLRFSDAPGKKTPPASTDMPGSVSHPAQPCGGPGWARPHTVPPEGTIANSTARPVNTRTPRGA